MGLIRRRADARQVVDMTEGNIFHHLLSFAMPMVIGNLFQQLYNTVDAWVVGNFADTAAFSAVGTVSPIINVLIGAFSGFSTGAGVIIAQYYGAKNEKRVKDAVHTAAALTLIFSILFTAVGVLMVPSMVRLMKTPPDVFPASVTYLTIYFAGIAGLLIYNMGSGILRAVGDSRHPFYYLVVAAILNVILDLLFVIVFHMGVAGVAFATIISQGISALLTVITLLRSQEWIRLVPRKIAVNRDILVRTVRLGIPSGFQLSVTALSNVFVQSYINQFGSACMGGWTAYSKIDPVLWLPMQSLSMATTTFVGQNLGSRQVDRAKEGIRTAMWMSVIVTATISALIVLFAQPLVSFFNDDPAVVGYGVLLLRWMIPFFVTCCVNQIHAGALRGAGNSQVPMLCMLSSFVIFRQVYLFVVSNYISNELIPLAFGYPAGWILCSALTTLYYRKKGLSGDIG